ncbi:adenylosuccinate synthetase [Aequorivita sp. SDUM287046]|uniref:Adenylosuccinate synthetase n=1 Tax=Aequorivita aurantiaca TaxID=3053356 RepID=A0ABT8DFW2_9FLAO|nr:adenylosuccinate synthetase [Aequorivita aurantiaca]MDN3723594.1 adenylosuccinate synthetase [Aequorivita aurantiaca]
MKKFNKFLLPVMMLLISIVYGQKPTEVPKPSDKPIDISNPADIIIYIILPLFAVLLFFVWRGKRKNK